MLEQREKTLFALVVIACLSLLLSGCHSARTNTMQLQPTPATRAKPIGFGAFLPRPGELPTGPVTPRAASFVETDCIKHGADFAGSLPSQNVEPGADDSLEFKATWSDASGKDLSRLAWCAYHYIIPGFNRSAELRYGWLTPPPSSGSVWFGLTNWDSDSWDWFPCNENGISSFAQAAPYFTPSDEVYVAVVCANDATSVLSYLRIGEQPAASIVLDSEPKYGFPPVELTISAAGSTVPVGGIDSYAWDLDNNGSFEVDTGADPQTSADFATAGESTVGLRLTSSYNEMYTGSGTLHLLGPWTHSWGVDRSQSISAVICDGSEFIYSAGYTVSIDKGKDALLMKHRLDGELIWAVAWGGTELDQLNDVVYDGNDRIYAVGQTASFGAGINDVLLQCWGTDGSIKWSRVIGTVENEDARGLALADDCLYIVGRTTIESVSPDVFLLKFGTDNTYKWALTWGGTEADAAHDIVALDDEVAGLQLFATGYTILPDESYTNVLLLQFDETGAIEEERNWQSDTYYKQIGNSISVDGSGTELQDVYISGTIGNMPLSSHALLLKRDMGWGGWATAWDNGDFCDADDVLFRDKIYLCGEFWEEEFFTRGSLVLGFDSTSGSLVNSAQWTDETLLSQFLALCGLPGAGILAAGYCEAADQGSWAPAEGTATSITGTWSECSGATGVPILNFANPAPAVEIISGMAIDIGGGNGDALASVVQFP